MPYNLLTLHQKILCSAGEFANNLPDFQKIEIMMFIMGKVPLPTDESQEADVLLQKILLKSLLKVCSIFVYST